MITGLATLVEMIKEILFPKSFLLILLKIGNIISSMNFVKLKIVSPSLNRR